jgi:hypothetical protein
MCVLFLVEQITGCKERLLFISRLIYVTGIATCEGLSIELLIYIKAKDTGHQTVTTGHEEKIPSRRLTKAYLLTSMIVGEGFTLSTFFLLSPSLVTPSALLHPCLHKET